MDSVSAQRTAIISRDALQKLLDALAENHEIIGPTARDGAIVYDRITRLADLPAGWTDHQAPGRYRLERRDDDALFGFTVGPQAWKRFLHRPVETLWTMSKTENGVTIESGESVTPNSPSSACVVASCTRSPSRIEYSHRALTRTWRIRCGDEMHSSLRSIAHRREEPVSAFRCRPGRKPRPDSTSH